MPKHLNLSRQSIEEIITALKAVADKESVESIDLSRGRITPDDAQTIADELKNFPNLRELNLSGNASLGGVVATITAACSKLEELGIGECGIAAEHAQAIASSLKRLTHLRKLNLGHNHRLNVSVTQIVAACRKLEDLDVRGCGITSEHAQAIAASLKNLPLLRMLNLCASEDLGVGAATIIEACNNLEELNLRYCEMPDKFLPQLKNILEKRLNLVSYSGESETFTNTMLIVDGKIHKPGMDYFEGLCLKVELGNYISNYEQAPEWVVSRGDQLACAARLHYIIDNFGKFEDCGFDKTELQATLKQLESQMEFLPNWFSGNGVCKALNYPSPLASLPKDMQREIGSYLKSSVARLTEAAEPPTVTIPGAVVVGVSNSVSTNSQASRGL